MATPDATDTTSHSDKVDGQDLSTDDLPTASPPQIAATSAHWQNTLEELLRFPGMDPHMRLFRPGNPVGEITFALGITDSDYTIIENDWVAIADRVFEIQTCCLMLAKQVDFDIAADGWITWDVTSEWCDRVLQELQSKGFRTTCTALVPFVLRVYLRSKSWIRNRQPRGRQRHKQIMETLEPDECAVIKQCSMVAKGFSSVIRQTRQERIERAQEHNLQSDVLSGSGDSL
ncbi:hypothetical protein J7T55_014258 [Diaporthe amygdali]|uniref:uncharacterized protein n=1 Tax=Phomopsis amygdali TaxID=1214568 RepID=UPI0022FE84E8|nr:uncharacterized protein J7T55_014258 [Diaporthe amygdali]KAJ0109696.1 hypothetical protein J7T55_014258 [Diaporthe amygdali]